MQTVQCGSLGSAARKTARFSGGSDKRNLQSHGNGHYSWTSTRTDELITRVLDHPKAEPAFRKVFGDSPSFTLLHGLSLAGGIKARLQRGILFNFQQQRYATDVINQFTAKIRRGEFKVVAQSPHTTGQFSTIRDGQIDQVFTGLTTQLEMDFDGQPMRFALLYDNHPDSPNYGRMRLACEDEFLDTTGKNLVRFPSIAYWCDRDEAPKGHELADFREFSTALSANVLVSSDKKDSKFYKATTAFFEACKKQGLLSVSPQ